MIRLYTGNDEAAVMDIWYRAAVSGHPFIDISYWNKNSGAVRDVYLPSSRTFVFEDEGRIAGFISLPEEKFIGALFVDPDFQRRGIGQALLAYVRQERNELCLNVYADNINAVNFYLKNGFKATEERTDTETGCAEIRMTWKNEPQTSTHTSPTLPA